MPALSVSCPLCSAPLTPPEGDESLVCAGGHAWSSDEFAAQHPFALVPSAESMLAVTGNRAWMVRRPRGTDTGWLLDLAAAATHDDWHLLHQRARAQLTVIFDTPADAIKALQVAVELQVRAGGVWQDNRTGERVKVTHVEHDGPGPDGTVYVQSLDDPDRAFSPGDFRVNYRKLTG